MMTCPTPLPAKDRILLGHGSGGKLSADLLRDVFLPVFRSPVLGRLDDQAVLEIGGERLAFTTDSFVVKPLFFRGGDIGSLAVHGTVNDLAMGGAEPLYLSAAFILEEGLSIDTLARIAESMGRAAAARLRAPFLVAGLGQPASARAAGPYMRRSDQGLIYPPSGQRTHRRTIRAPLRINEASALYVPQEP